MITSAQGVGALAGALFAASRKRPSPLLSGSPNTWASGIVRTIGWVNFLNDPSQTPHMLLSDIDPHFGVSESSGAAKLRLRRSSGEGEQRAVGRCWRHAKALSAADSGRTERALRFAKIGRDHKPCRAALGQAGE